MSSPTKKTIELFYDVISPFTWIGFETLVRYQSRWNIQLKLKPFFLGGIMAGSDNRPPGMVPNKGSYMEKDLHRLRQHYGIPINRPEDVATTMFVKGSLPTQRFLTAIDMTEPKYLEAVTREMFMRIWSRDQDIIMPESLAEAGQAVGLSEALIKDCLAKIKEDSIKTRLKQYTQEALDYGAFGSPTIIVHDAQGEKHLVFGSDRMHIIADLIGEEYVGPLKDLAKTKL